MYDHIGLRVKDLAASVRFYRSALEPLGHEITYQSDGMAGFGSDGTTGLWLGHAPDAGERGERRPVEACARADVLHPEPDVVVHASTSFRRRR